MWSASVKEVVGRRVPTPCRRWALRMARIGEGPRRAGDGCWGRFVQRRRWTSRMARIGEGLRRVGDGCRGRSVPRQRWPPRKVRAEIGRVLRACVHEGERGASGEKNM